MNPKITKLKPKKLIVRRLLTLGGLLLSFNFAFSNIWSPYCEHRRPTTAGYGCVQRLAIQEVRIEQGTDLLFRKAPDGCAGPFNTNTGTNSTEWGKVINSENNPVILSAGATYRLGMSSSGSVIAVGTAYGAAWIDYNYNKAFVDAGELLNTSTTSWIVNSPIGNPGNVSYINFTIPCSVNEGVTRLRISLDNATNHVALDKSCITVANTPSIRPYWGETEDLYIRILKSTTLAVDFIAPTDVFVNSPVTFVNKNRAGFISHEWDRGLNGYDFTGVDYTTEFATPGTQQLKLRSTNCSGVDSVIKTINVQLPTQAPSVDFVASRTSVEVGNQITLYDLSSQGPQSWNWQLNNPVQPAFNKTNTEGTPIGFMGKYNQVIFNMNDVGVFNVCLTATNSQGFSSACKNSYINVTPISEFRLGIGDNVTPLATGTIYDRGGRNGNYSTGALGDPMVNKLLIQPCGAEEIKLTITQLRFADNNHALRVWDGPNSGGIPLHPQGGFNRTNSEAPITIIAKSGLMYMELNTAAGTATDSGLIAHFESILGQTTPPIPSFNYAVDGQTQAFRNAITSFRSNSSNLFGLPTYGWSVNGVTVNPSNTAEGGRLLNYQFPSTGNYQVCLNVISCAGDSTFCRTINVVNPVGQTRLEFDASNVRPNIDETVTFSTISDKASNFRWEIAPLTYQLVAPSTLNSQNLQVKFMAPGPYRVQLRGWNTADSAGTTRLVVKDSFIQVVNYCNVTSQVLSSDVGNNLLQVRNSDNALIYSMPSSSGVQGYQNFSSSSDPINVLLGGYYTITMRRNTNFDKVSRAVYADWNGDGNFTANERIMYSYNSDALTYSETFRVPDLNQVILGPVRMRAITSYSTTPINPCQDVAAGEIEDYRLWLYPATEAPSITMLGSPLVYVARGGTYTDAGATGFDPVEGDVTYRIQTSSNVNLNAVGQYFVRYNLKNATNVSAQQKERIIIVTADNEAPVITMLGNNPDYLEAGNGAYVDPGVTAFDNVDGDVTALVVKSGSVNHLSLGNYAITYSVNDASGNNATAIRNVTVGDKTKPVINFVGQTDIELGSVWTDMTFATDNFWSGSNLVLSKTFGFNGPVNPNVRGTYEVNYTAVDGSGNTSTASRTYRVDDFTAPTIILNTPEVILHDVNTPYTSVNPTIFDNFTATSALSIFKTGTVNPNVLGTYTELFRAIDEAGNRTERTRTVHVVDRIAPTIATPYICTRLFNVFNNKHGILVEDNYYSPEELLPLVDIIQSNVNIFIEGMYTCTYVVTDPSGNRSQEVVRQVEVNQNCAVISSVNNVNAESMIQVYPNPSNGEFSVNLGVLASKANAVKVYNSVGELVAEVSTDKLESNVSFSLSGVASGVYMVQVSGSDFLVTKKLVLVK